jgi:hypothetical protein
LVALLADHDLMLGNARTILANITSVKLYTIIPFQSSIPQKHAPHFKHSKSFKMLKGRH